MKQTKRKVKVKRKSATNIVSMRGDSYVNKLLTAWAMVIWLLSVAGLMTVEEVLMEMAKFDEEEAMKHI